MALLSMLLPLILSTSQALPLEFEEWQSEPVVDALEFHQYVPFMKRLGEIPLKSDSEGRKKALCDGFYDGILDKKEMRFALALGYYDSSENFHQYEYDGKNYGMNAAIDPMMYTLFKRLITSPCSGSLRLCEFKEDPLLPGVFTRKIKVTSRRFEGRTVTAIIEMRHPALTPYHQTNTVERRDEQWARSKLVTEWFLSSFRTADFVIYYGHSRKGGGPDFYPPELLKNRLVNYEGYVRERANFRTLLDTLQIVAQLPKAYLVMSCDSADHFEADLERVAPRMGKAFTTAVIEGSIPARGALAGIDAFLKFQCRDGVQQHMSLDSDMREFLKLDLFRSP